MSAWERKRQARKIAELRVQMIEQTNAFLSWALAAHRADMRVPR